MKKYNHAYSLGFAVNTDRDAQQAVNKEEIINALLERIVNLNEHDEWDEALGAPFDTYENEEPGQSEALKTVLEAALKYSDETTTTWPSLRDRIEIRKAIKEAKA
jgi:hypothetical protein